MTYRKPKRNYVPITPGDTPLFELGAPTERQAWDNLLKDAAHMPYEGIEGFKARGYWIHHFTRNPHD